MQKMYEGGPSWGCIAMAVAWILGFALIGLAWDLDIVYLAMFGLAWCAVAASLTVVKELNGHDQMVRREMRRARERSDGDSSLRSIR